MVINIDINVEIKKEEKEPEISPIGREELYIVKKIKMLMKLVLKERYKIYEK